MSLLVLAHLGRSGQRVIKWQCVCVNVTCWCAGHIVAVDSMKPTVFVITEGGELLRWFDCANYMREPSDIAIFGNDYYVCDFKVRVIFWSNFTLISILRLYWTRLILNPAAIYSTILGRIM